MAEEVENKSLNEIVFEHRNKEYGAYDLRYIYRKTLTKSFLIGASIFILSIIVPYSVMAFSKAKKKGSVDVVIDVIDVNIPDKPIIEEKPAPPPPPKEKPEPPKKVEMKKDIVPEPKKEVVKEDPPPTKEELKDAAIGTVDQEGEKTEEQAPPPPPTEDEGSGAAQVDLNEVQTNVDQTSEFPGGINKLRSKVQRVFEYPEDAADDGIQGTVIVRFVVERDGSMSGFKVVQSVHPSLDEEAVRCLKTVKDKWKPGMLNGQPVRTYYTFPFKFQLDQ